MQPLNSAVFFIDDCLGSHELSGSLRAQGYLIRVLLEEADDPCSDVIKTRNDADEEWIPRVAAEGWIILTSDKARSRPIFKQVILASGAACFVFTATNVKGSRQAELISKAMPAIEKKCRQYSRPLLGKITPSGSVDICDGVRRGSINRDLAEESATTN